MTSILYHLSYLDVVAPGVLLDFTYSNRLRHHICTVIQVLFVLESLQEQIKRIKQIKFKQNIL